MFWDRRNETWLWLRVSCWCFDYILRTKYSTKKNRYSKTAMPSSIWRHMHFSKNLFIWRHFETTSDLLFNKSGLSLSSISSFSLVQSLHRLVAGLYGGWRLMILHFISNVPPLSLMFQISFDNSVSSL